MLVCLGVEHLKVFEHRLRKKEFRRKTQDVMGGYRTLHTEQFHNLYSL
jgi:hypothetical protein